MDTNTAGEPRHPMIISGAIRAVVERMRAYHGDVVGASRIDTLLDELEQSLTIQQFSDSLKLPSPEPAKSSTVDAQASTPQDATSLSSGSTQRNEGGRKTGKPGVNAVAWFSGQSFNGGTR